MSQTQAQAAVMESTAHKFETTNDSLQTMLKRLMDELSVLQSAWQGSGGRSFEQVKIAWEADQKKLQLALRETATAIRTSGKQYTATDDEASGRMKNIHHGGGVQLAL
jgi:WXG100 family type VII secretion target